KTFLSEAKEGVTPVTIWKYEEVGHTHEANNELKALDLGGVFENPKPTRLIKRMVELCVTSGENGIILDFFAGSCTTAQAVLELNREDGGNRRFIMVQLPEPTGNKDYVTIADIGKERIRRVIAKMKKESAGKLDLKNRETPEDLGFKVFKLAESNYRQWHVVANAMSSQTTPEQYAAQVEMFIDPLVDGWNAKNVIYEVAVKEGYGLNCRIEEREDVEGHVYCVTDPDKEQAFFISLDDKIRLDALKPLGLTRDHLFICRDRALDDDAAANLALQCRLKTI
ncbi:MAG TPA: DNA methyltransferase, partial [Anaerolineae bacterium]